MVLDEEGGSCVDEDDGEMIIGSFMRLTLRIA
jgi:hypothetical protein